MSDSATVDIFISYSSKDRERARAFATALTDLGWSVWWDRHIPTGKTYFEVIEEALTAARCVLVLWSSHSVQSSWVIEEAEQGRNRGILLPVFLENVSPPMGFRLVQAIDLSHWQGDISEREFQRLIAGHL